MGNWGRQTKAPFCYVYSYSTSISLSICGAMTERGPWHPAHMMSTGSCLCCSWQHVCVVPPFGEEHVHPYSGEGGHVFSGCLILPKHLLVISVVVKDVGGKIIFKTLHRGWMFCALWRGTKVDGGFWVPDRGREICLFSCIISAWSIPCVNYSASSVWIASRMELTG